MTRTYYTRVVVSTLIIAGSLLATAIAAGSDGVLLLISFMYFVLGLMVAFPAANEVRRQAA